MELHHAPASVHFNSRAWAQWDIDGSSFTCQSREKRTLFLHQWWVYYMHLKEKRITFEIHALGVSLAWQWDIHVYIHSLMFSRARTEQYGGAWCPLNQITFVPNDWLEIDFGNLTYLTQVETQGRFDNGRGKEYADYYILMYTRTHQAHHAIDEDDDAGDDLTSWIAYKPNVAANDEKNSSWIRANQNTYMGEIRALSTCRQTWKRHVERGRLSLCSDPPIVATRLRFYPVSKQTRTVCMRVEA